MNILFFDETNTLRSGWRAMIFIAAFAISSAVFAALFLSAVRLIDPNGVYSANSLFLIGSYTVSLIPALIMSWLCGKYLEHLPFRALGAAFTDGWLKHLTFGLVIGTVTLCFAVLIAAVFGGERFRINAEAGIGEVAASLAISFAVFAVASAFEEVVFRGYVLQTFTRSGLAWLAILLTSVLFGAVHLRNTDSTWFSTLNTVLAGVWFSLAYLRTRDLWFVWGIHLMWNWMQGSFFGIEVSGLTDITSAPFLKEIDTGPTWLTGTTYGIEGGIACTIAIVISMAALYFLPLKPADSEVASIFSKRPTSARLSES